MLGRIFDEAIAMLPPTMQTSENRTAIAKLVLERAGGGEARLVSLRSLMDAIASAA